MAYYLEFGQNADVLKPRYLVITTESDLETGITEWNELQGTSTPVVFRFDSDKKTPWHPILKTSIIVTLYRQSEGEFSDIINGSDQNIVAYVTEGADKITDDYKVPASATLIFKGTLTMETWSEEYLPTSTIKLTFHDKLGHLSEGEYLPATPYQTFTKILADCLINVVMADNYLVLDWPYSIRSNDTKWENPSFVTKEYAHEFIVDVTKWVGKPKKEVIENLLKSYGFQIFQDPSYKFGDYSGAPPVEEAGAIRIRLIANQAYKTITQTLYKKNYNIVDGTIKDYFYELQTTESVTGETLYSALFCYLDTAMPPTDTLYNIVIFTIGTQKYHVAYKQGGGDLSGEDKAVLLIEAGDLYEVVSAFTYTAYNAAMLALIGTDYENIGNVWTAKAEGAAYDFTVVDYNLGELGFVETTAYQSAELTVTTGKFDEIRTERVLNTPADNADIPLLDRKTRYELDMKAKRIEAFSKYAISESIVFPTEFLSDYIDTVDGERVFKIAKEIAKRDGSTYTESIKNSLLGLFRYPYAKIDKVGGEQKLGLKIDVGTDTPFITFGSAIITKETGTTVNIEYEGFCDQSASLFLYILARYGNVWYVYKGSDFSPDDGWTDFNTIGATNYTKENVLAANSYTTQTITGLPHPTMPTGEQYEMYFVFFTAYSGTHEQAYLTLLNCSINGIGSLPDGVKLTTNINPDNRQIVKVESKFYNVPAIAGAESVIKSGLYVDNYNPCYTVTYRTASQTLLAHLSDQYGNNYTSNRWLLDAKILIPTWRLQDMFTLEDRSFIFVDGTYDAKRNFLDGRFIQIIIPSRLPGWLWENEEDILWEDEQRALLE